MTKKAGREKDKFVKLFQYVTGEYTRLNNLIWKRCALEGCRYGYEMIDKEPADKCIYCGEPRNYYFDTNGPIKSIAKTLKKTQTKTFMTPNPKAITSRTKPGKSKTTSSNGGKFTYKIQK